MTGADENARAAVALNHGTAQAGGSTFLNSVG
ncbi:Uncharacterised protein [Vibrio cholerae]|nr:Uncharacterised protein [Vibrio cholerae]CSI86767.1 Uncharacterised protein [Vibrio cholerae]